MKASKKFLSLLLVLTMVFSFAATTASAEGFLIFGGNSKADSTDSTPSPAPSASQAPQQDATIIGGDDESGEETDDNTKDDKQVEDEVTDPEAIIVGTEKTYKYATLREAIADAAEGATVQLVKDITLSAPLTISKNLKLDMTKLNGTPSVITFANSSNLHDAALVIDGGAVVTIKEGELCFVADADEDGNEFGFVNGVYAEDGSVSFFNMVIGGEVVGGSVLSNAADGSISVKSNCALDFDPSAYVSEDYKVVDYDGMYAVVDADPSEDDTPSTNEIKPTQEGDIILATADTTANAKLDKITENTTLNLNGKALTGDITVASGVTLRIINSGELHPTTGQPKPVDAAGITGNITLDGGALIVEDDVTITGNITMKNGSSLTVNDSAVEVTGNVTAESGAKVSGSVTAGKFGSALPTGLVPDTHERKADGTIGLKTAPTGNFVTDASGNAFNTTNNYPQYFKGKTELASAQSLVRLDSTVFKLSSANVEVYIDSSADTSKKLLENTNYKLDGTNLTFITTNAVTGTDNEVIIPTFTDVTSGAHKIIFKFASGTPAEVAVDIFVWPSVETVELKHVVGEEAGVKLKVSDEPKHVVVDDKELTGTDWTWADGTLSITAPALDALTPGDRLLGISYDAGELNENSSVFYNALSIINVTPVEANKDNKWLNSNTALSYNASHAVSGVKVDGNTVDAANYSVSDKNVLSLKAAYLKSLPYGEHTMVVTLAGEEVTIKFTTAPSLVPKDATNHTKGGQKDLVFIASDPMDTVWVGKTQLKADYYTISSDGKTITLKAAFLNTLKADTTYNITTAKSNGNNGYTYNAVSSFRILSAASAGATPGTGDSANFGLWIALLVISGAAIAVILPKRRKEN